MNSLLRRFRECKEKLRRKLICKLGGFCIMPPSGDHIIIKSTTVEPTEFLCKAFFSQHDLYDITPANLEEAAKETMRSKLISRIIKSDMIDFSVIQDENTGEIEMRASVWLVDPKKMKAAKGQR